MLKKFIIDLYVLVSKGFNRFFQVNGIPKNDCCGDQIQAARPLTLLLKTTISNFTKLVKEDRASQRITSFTFV